MLQVSRWTIQRRVVEYGLNCGRWSDIDDDQLDTIIRGYISRHGVTTGQSYIIGHIRSLGYLVQRDRVRAAINRVDPANTALRWAAVITHRVYSVPWPNSLWHIDGHHSLIRWGFVVHGCIDGFSSVQRTIDLILLCILLKVLLASMACHHVFAVIMEVKMCW